MDFLEQPPDDPDLPADASARSSCCSPRAATRSAGRRWRRRSSRSSLSLLLFATVRLEPRQRLRLRHADGGGGVVQIVQQADWIPAFNIEYKVGIDGLSFPLVILSHLHLPAVAASRRWNIEKMTKGYMALFLFLETGILGVFLVARLLPLLRLLRSHRCCRCTS